jgi:hypothetical protein
VIRLGFFIVGRSTTVVTPPYAAAAVPYLKPSQSSLATSYKLVLQSIIPGKTM